MKFVAAGSVLSAALSSFALSSIASQEQASKTANSIHYEMSVVADKGIKFPRLASYKNIAVMERVNAQIDEVTREFGCSERRDKDDSFEVFSRVEYAARDIFSIYASASYNCGGPYPTNDANISLTFDMRTGKKVEFAELFRNYEADKGSILKIIFAGELARAERVLASEKSDDGCLSLFKPEVLEDSAYGGYAYNFSEKGLVVQPRWPHVIEACAERVTVPYQQLREFAAPNSILARAIL